MAVWTEKFINPNKYSRPQNKLIEVRKIVMHYTANNGATANGHYNYFNNLKGTYASAHFFVDKTEKLLIIPLSEIAYHANDRTYRGVKELLPNANFLSIGIEMCLEKDGSFHPQTIVHAEEVAVELCKRYKLDPLTDIVRHYDVTQKNCPAPWVSNVSLFTKFKNNVNIRLNPVKVVSVTPKAPAPTVASVIKNGIKDGGSGDMKLELNQSQFDMIADLLKEATAEGILSDNKWEEKARKGELTLSEAIFLALVIDHRRK